MAEHEDVWGYSLGVTEAHSPLYEYPEPGPDVTDELTNFELPADPTPASPWPARGHVVESSNLSLQIVRASCPWCGTKTGGVS